MARSPGIVGEEHNKLDVMDTVGEIRRCMAKQEGKLSVATAVVKKE